MTDTLVIFAKNPELGNTKTRIGKKLGDEVALAVYYKLIHHTQSVTQSLSVNKVVYYSNFIDKEDSWDNQIYQKKKQVQFDLGERMNDAINQELNLGAGKVVLIGTDIYTLTEDIIKDAFEKLNSHDVVLGPSKDGGYYLIGLKKLSPLLFGLKEWSHPEVYNQTISLIKDEKLSYSTTQFLNDIDEPEDLFGTDLEKLIT